MRLENEVKKTTANSPQIFHVLKDGEVSPKGPYSKEELEELLTLKVIGPTDFVYYPNLKDWQRISEVFEFHKGPSDFIDDCQDLQTVTESFRTIRSFVRNDERVHYIAVQFIAPSDRISEILQPTPRAVALTSEQIIVIEPKLIGESVVDTYPHSTIKTISTEIDRRRGNSKAKPSANQRNHLLKIELKSGETVIVNNIPDKQLVRFLEIANQSKTNFN